MINRRITILGPEGTNIYVIFQYLIFCVISWFTLFNITNEIGLDIQNVLVRQITFTLIGLIVFFLFTYVSISNIFWTKLCFDGFFNNLIDWSFVYRGITGSKKKI